MDGRIVAPKIIRGDLFNIGVIEHVHQCLTQSRYVLRIRSHEDVEVPSRTVKAVGSHCHRADDGVIDVVPLQRFEDGNDVVKFHEKKLPARPVLNLYLEAARPRTLPAAVAPVLVGTAAADVVPDGFSAVRAVLALVVALALQVAVNYANDYFDGVKGVDTEARVGPRRAVASGLLSTNAVKAAMVVALLVGALAGLGLAVLAGWELLLVGVAALLATLGYSGGSKPYASAGLGEIVVFVFFGLVATVGSAYVQDEALTIVPALAAIPMGTFAVALLVVNNLRDVATDAAVGKRTLAVRLGERRTRTFYAVLMATGFVMLLPLGLVAQNAWLALPLLAAPLAYAAVRTVLGGARGMDLIGALAPTAQAQLVYAAMLTVALVASS